MKHHAVIIYHSYADPIFKGLMLQYLKEFQNTEGRSTFHLITFEQAQYKLEPAQIEQEKKKLYDEYNIIWRPISYHSGGLFILAKKAWDLLLCGYTVFKISKKQNLSSIIGFTSISGSIAYIISRFIKTRLIVLNIEPHSEYMVEFGYWKRWSISYHVLKYFENKLIRNADHVAVPTQNAFNLLVKDSRIKGNLHFVPTSINLSDFQFDLTGRKSLRKKLGVNDDCIVVLYLGKFGGIYFEFDEMLEVFLGMNQVIDNLFFYIITPNQTNEIERSLANSELRENSLVAGSVPYEELSYHLSASDLGVLLIPSYPSQQFRCPIKTANYLACGLPYLITENIGDDSRIALENNIGIVINDKISSFEGVKSQFKNLTTDRSKLQSIVQENRDISLVTNFLKLSLS